MNTQEEEYVTLFCEGDGGVGLNDRGYPKINFSQKERGVLDYIATRVVGGCFYQNHRTSVWTLQFHGSHCIFPLEMFSRHVVGKSFLGRLNRVLKHVDMPLTTQHPLTLDGLVGFWDAEGSSGNIPQISISQKDREILDLIALWFGGGVILNSDGTHEWYSSSKTVHALAEVILERSHCLGKRERLRQNFEGPPHYEMHKEEIKAYARRHYAENAEEKKASQSRYYAENREERLAYAKKRDAERKAIQEWIKTHPEEVTKLQESS